MQAWPAPRAGRGKTKSTANRLAVPSIIVMGFGPAGRTVAEQAKKLKWRVTVLDLNQRAILDAKELGYRAYVGDVSAAAVLELAEHRPGRRRGGDVPRCRPRRRRS
jgi:D-arabinose 1-dehydrogenase-like Zn-dependent alcohol dehydrogenase